MNKKVTQWKHDTTLQTAIPLLAGILWYFSLSDGGKAVCYECWIAFFFSHVVALKCHVKPEAGRTLNDLFWLELCLLYFFQNAVQDPFPYQYLKSNSLQTQISPSRQCWICLLFFTAKSFMNAAVWISALYYPVPPSRLGINIFQLPEIAQKAARSIAHWDV